MFRLGKKARAAEAIERGVRAVLTGAYFHHSEIELIGLNNSASAWLLTEAYAHQVYALGCISAHALRKDRWATMEFFVESAIEGMRKSGDKDGPSVEQLAPVIFKRYAIFEALSGGQRMAGDHFRDSACLVKDRDQSADVNKIAIMLKKSTDKYVADVQKMFGV